MTENPDDDWIGDDELYHRYVDMIAEHPNYSGNAASVVQAAESAIITYEERIPHTKKKLTHVLQVMFYAHSAATLRRSAEETLTALL
jgi:hypothetical protein